MTEQRDESGIPVLIRADLHQQIVRLAKSKNRSVSREVNALLDYAIFEATKAEREEEEE